MLFKPTALACALAALVVVPGFAQDAKTNDIVMLTGTPTGTWFPTGAAFAEFANNAAGSQVVSVTPGAGSIGNIMGVAAGKADMGLSYGAFLKAAEEGDNEINPGEPIGNLRSVMALTPNVLHVLLADDAGVSSLEELAESKGKIHVGTGVPGSTEDFGLARLLGLYDIEYSDLEEWGGSVIRGVTTGRNDGWQNRQLELVSFMFTPPNPNIDRLLGSRDGSIFSLSEEQQQTFVDKYGFAPVTIAAGTYEGQDEDVRAVGLPTTLFSTTEVSEEIVYNMVKGIAEDMDRLKQVSSAYGSLEPEDLMTNLGIEMHEGAKRYYAERGWIQ